MDEDKDLSPLVMLKAVMQLPTDSVQASIDVITKACHNVPYEDKRKWLVFGGDPRLVTLVAAKLRRDHRKRHGTNGRRLDMHVVKDAEGLSLYVHADFRY